MVGLGNNYQRIEEIMTDYSGIQTGDSWISSQVLYIVLTELYGARYSNLSDRPKMSVYLC